MIKKQQQFIPKGMNQDIAQTKVQSEFAHSIKNLRVVTDEKDGILSLVTEKGTLLKQFPQNFFMHTNEISEEITPYFKDVVTDGVVMRTLNKAANTYYELFLRVKLKVKLVYSTEISEALNLDNVIITASRFYFGNGYVISGSSTDVSVMTNYDVSTQDYTTTYTVTYSSNCPAANNRISMSSNEALIVYLTNTLDDKKTEYTLNTYIPVWVNASDVPLTRLIEEGDYDHELSDDEKMKLIIEYVGLKENNYITKDLYNWYSGHSPFTSLPTMYYYYDSSHNITSISKQIELHNILNATVVNKDLILFGKVDIAFRSTEDPEIIIKELGNKDCIFKIENFNNITQSSNLNEYRKILYTGNLNFNINYPIKTYVSYENEKTIKVYWIDGLNQPRVINITKTYEYLDSDDDNHFNFCTPIYCNETVNITKNATGGFFHSGVIQYFMTYVDQNDQESKIFYQSPLYYLTDSDRALSPDENSTNSFVIDIKGVNTNKLLRNKLRIYSLQRTSLDATPVAKLIYELKLTENTTNISVIDTGNIGMNIDPQILLMIGCEEFIPQTFAVKDQIVFFGNIETKNYQKINDIIANKLIVNSITISDEDDRTTAKQTQEHLNVSYSSNFQLNGINPIQTQGNKNGSDEEIKGFMYNEEYMLGLQFLHKSGDWTEPIWVGDFIMNKPPYSQGEYQYMPYFSNIFSNSIIYVKDNDPNDIRETSVTGYTAKGTLNYLIERGYIAVRPLIVFNDQQNCRILCQGLLNPTIEYNNTYYPSWFFRPLNSGTAGISRGEYKYFINAQSGNDLSVIGEVQGFDSKFKVKYNLLTFNSPEIEFEKITTINKYYNFNFIGVTEIHANTYDIEILTSTCTYGSNANYGANVEKGTIWYGDSKKTFVGGFCWKDKTFQKDEGSYPSAPNDSVYYIWPWENNQSYSCAPKTDNDVIYSAPERKIISNYRYSQYFKKLSSDSIHSIKSIKIANNSYIRTNVATSTTSGSEKEAVYIKDVDILCTGDVDTNYSNGKGNRHVLDTTGLLVNGNEVNAPNCNVVRIQYKTTPHIILSIDEYSNHTSGLNNTYGVIQVGELMNAVYNDSTKFKGRIWENNKWIPTETSMYENVWYIGGETVKLEKDSTITVKWTKGDTYYQRYDCLKTYPYSHEAQNSVIDVLSCMIQTRINLDGRYDKNRCADILHIDNTNFNKLNDVYSQKDNFFTYHKLDSDRFQNLFPNLVTWSKQKVFGESIDSWTNIHLTNVLDLDGNLGKITSIKLWNNRLIAFQNKGISVIKYNENVAIPTATGTPIALMNSGLVSGKEYITNQFGCQNEWSIVNAKSGLYFSDDYNHKLYVLSDGIKCISDNLGFKSYLKTKNYTGTWKPNTNTWTLANGGTLHTFYDQQLGEIYFTDGEDCLTFNENLNLFTAFYDYKNDTNKRLFDFVNIENKNYWILNNFTSNVPIFYEHRATDNLNIFDTIRDYSIELTSNIDPHLDKVFDTVEIRGDAYISNNLQSGYNIVGGVNTTSLPFDKLQVSNEYQDTGEQTLNFIKDKPYSSTSNMKQKFRIWRAAIGRNKKNNQNTRDRIRNYWSRIKLIKTATNNLRAKIHDIIVNVYE